MKKIRPFLMVFLFIQCVILAAVVLLPGLLFPLYAGASVQDQPLVVLWLLAALVLLLDSCWVGVVTRRCASRGDMCRWGGLAVWAACVGVTAIASMCVGNYLAYEAADLVAVLPLGLPVAAVLWLPAYWCSFSED